MWIIMGALLLLGLPAAGVWGEVLCPYDLQVHEEDILRNVVLNRPEVLSAIRADLGIPNNKSAFLQITQVRGETRFSPNRVLVDLNYERLTPATQTLVTDAGCQHLATTDAVQAVMIQPREPRLINGILDFDSEDATRIRINPERFGNPPNLRVGAVPRPNFWALLEPPAAYAITNAPSTAVLEACSGAEDPLADIWTARYDSNDAGGLGETAGHCGRVTCSGTCSSYYDINTAFTADQEAYATMQDATGSEAGLLEVIFGCVTATLGGATPTCYKVRMTERTATDEYIMIAYNGSSNATICGSAIVQESNDNEVLMGRRTGSTIAMHLGVGGSWSIIDSCTDTTYTGAGGIAFATNANNMFFDDMGGGSLPVGGGGRRKNIRW